MPIFNLNTTSFGASDDLTLPSGHRVGDVSADKLHTEFTRLKIPGHTSDMGREAALQAYANHLQSIHNAAGSAAVNAWMASNRVTPT